MTNTPHGGDTATYFEQYGKIPLDFSSNTNPLGLPLRARLALLFAKGLSSYPDPLSRGLKEAVASFEEVLPSHLCFGNGASDLIFRIAFALRPRKALVPVPAFLEYERALCQAGAEIVTYPLKAENKFALTEEILEHIDNMDILFLCNPNNPTGSLTGRELLIRIARKCADTGCILVIDECFIDFLEEAEGYSMKGKLENFPNLIILKAFTKTFAMAGLRLGYLLCAGPGMVEKIENAGQPWPVSRAAAVCALACIKGRGYISKTKRLIAAEGAYLQKALAGLGFRVYPFSANFLMFRSDDPGLFEKLQKEGILIRDCHNFKGLEKGYYRVAVKKRAKNKKLIGALRAIKEGRHG